MTEVGQSESVRSPRFTHWLAFLVFSTITLGSAVETVSKIPFDGDVIPSSWRWAVACSAITFTITFIVVLMHLSPVVSLYIIGTKVEGIICILLVIFWVATVGVITDSKYGLAVNSNGAVSNGNLYYFSWAGFICSVTLTVSYLRCAYNVDVAGEIRTRAARLNYWSALLASSLVVMGSSVNIYSNYCIGAEDDLVVYCRRTKFGIGLGTVATFLALFVVSSKIATSKAPFIAEAAFSLLLMIMYVFGVAYITSQQGPGAPLGNLYYFTWLSFLATFMLLASCFEDYQAAKGSAAGNARDENADQDEGDIHVESLDENI